MAEACSQNRGRDFWAEARNANRKNSSFPSMVDGVVGEKEICDHFRSQYDDLYNCVSFSPDDMDVLLSDMNVKCSSVCRTSLCYDNHCVSVNDVERAVKKLKVSKADSTDLLSSDHFIFACKELYVHISMLLTMALQHADVPGALAHSVLVPILKNAKKSKSDASNYRSIAISSIIGKIFDNVVLAKHGDVLQSSELQFGFCKNRSTSMCTFILEEVVNYYSQLDAPVYISLLDASRAFDRVNFIKLFKLLLHNNFCAMNAKFLITAYISQTLCVRWCNAVSSSFHCSNGVKQGGVLSPVLFCTYMDALLGRLSKLGVGCYVGGSYVGALSYADDLSLIAPTRSAMQRMLNECERFATEYDVVFNGSKSVSMVVNSRLGVNAPRLTLNGQPIPKSPSAVHLGHYIGRDSHSLNVQKAMSDMYGRLNSLLCNYKYCNFECLRSLFLSFCSSFYGCTLWKLSDIEQLCVCWRKCVRRLFKLPPRTHSVFIPLLVRTPDLQTQLVMRFSKFVFKCLHNSNAIVRLCTKLCFSSTSSVNSNVTLMRSRLSISSSDLFVSPPLSRMLYARWRASVDEAHIERCALITELLNSRDGLIETPLNRNELEFMLSFVCIE